MRDARPLGAAPAEAAFDRCLMVAGAVLMPLVLYGLCWIIWRD